MFGLASDPRPTATTPATAWTGRLLTVAEFHRLADLPPEVEWFVNLINPQTRRACRTAMKDCVRVTGITRPDEFRAVTRTHIIAWPDELVCRGLGGSRVRNRVALPTLFFRYVSDDSAVTHNLVKDVAQPTARSSEGRTSALGAHQARRLLEAPDVDMLKSKRDRAILSTPLFHTLRRGELFKLKVRDFRHARKGVRHLRVSGNGGKIRYLPLHSGINALIHEYLEVAGNGEEDGGALFRRVRNNRTGWLGHEISTDGIYKLGRTYSAILGFQISVNALRPTAATN